MELERLNTKECFKSIETSVLHEELEVLIKSLNRYKIENIQFNTKNIKLREIDDKIRAIVIRAKLNFNSNDSEILQILKSTIGVLLKVFEKSSTKYLSIFLSINCYLEIDLKDYFDYLKKNRKFKKNKLSKNIYGLIKNFSFEINTRSNSPYNEKELFKEYNDGLKELNINKVYALVESIERGGRGFYDYPLFKSLIHFLFRIDFTIFIRFLNRAKQPKEAVFILQTFTVEEVLKISSSKSLKNKWILIELIRLNSKNFKKDETPKSISSTLNCLRLIYKINSELHKQSIIYFHDSGLLNKVFGVQHKDLDSDIINSIINSLPINQYNHFVNQRKKLKEGQVEVLDKKDYEDIIKVIFHKWLTFFESLFSDKEFYLNDILLTDYADFVGHYYSLITDKKLIQEVKETVNQIIWIDSEWHYDKSAYITKSYLYLSKLYILSCAYTYKSIKSEEIDGLKLLFYKKKDIIFNNNVNNHKSVFSEIENNFTN